MGEAGLSAPDAAVLLIGDELLSGRTRDVNLSQIASFLAPLGIPVRECRIVSDEQSDIVQAVNALRARYTYVFTTGGIGPTHDDITADAIATAFEVGIGEHAEAIAILAERYKAADMVFTPARRRMARVPEGASLVKNPVSGAPGFQIGNVFTLAGVPSVARAMLEDIGHRLEAGAVVHSVSVRGKGAMEGALAELLGQLAADMPEVSLGSYPWFKSRDDHGVTLVARGTDNAKVEQAASAMADLLKQTGITPQRLSEVAP